MVCVCNRLSVREACMNYDVVVFQPRTLTPLYLGSISYHYTFKIGLPPHLFLPFSVSFFYLLLITSSPYLAIHHQSPLFFHLLPTSSLGAERCLPERFLHPQTTSLCHLSLHPAPHVCVYRRFPWRCAPPFAALGLHPSPCHTLGGSPVAGPSAPLCSCLSLPEISSKS